MLVTWNGPGGISLPSSPEWKLELFTAYDGGSRPAAQFKNTRTGATVSFLIFKNQSGTPTSAGCRKDVMDAIERGQGKLISNSTTSEMPDGHGGKFAIASHDTHLAGDASNHDIFAFVGDANVCAEAHASVVSGTPGREKQLNDALAVFHPDLSYRPDWRDYWIEALAFRGQSQMVAAPFYAAALHGMPTQTSDPEVVTARRVATDEVVMALGMSGKVQQARAYAETAIRLDPDYPINYYNLACADVEEGKVAEARSHLQQAFARKANVIAGEKMPEPKADDSIQKLRNDKAFWAFVQTLK